MLNQRNVKMALDYAYGANFATVARGAGISPSRATKIIVEVCRRLQMDTLEARDNPEKLRMRASKYLNVEKPHSDSPEGFFHQLIKERL